VTQLASKGRVLQEYVDNFKKSGGKLHSASFSQVVISKHAYSLTKKEA